MAVAKPLQGPEDSAASVPVTVRMGGGARREWRLAEEAAVNLLYNGRPYVVMMATPRDLADFARGFSLAEGVLASAEMIRAIEVTPVDGGIAVDVATASGADIRPRQERGMEGRSGCGLCGVESLAQVVHDIRRLRSPAPVAREAIARAFRELPERQTMNRINHSVHAAAWADLAGAIRLIREDVGRHTALDKLIGAMVAVGEDPSAGFCVMTSRCSFELVQKAAAVGIACLATVSAPTALALDLADRAGMTLAALSPEGVVLFEIPESS